MSDIPLCSIFAKISPKARDNGKNKQMWLHQIKTFCMTKETNIEMKRERIVWENIFGNDTSDKGLISEIYQELT